MRLTTTLALLTFVCVSSSTGLKAATLRSGLQEGDYPLAYYVSDVTGPRAGQRLCYRCNYGSRPVVNIFIRNMNERVASLVKEIDNIVAENEDRGMAAFVVVLTDEPARHEESLRTTAQRYRIRHSPLTVFNNTSGPGKYKLSEAADVTVMMWVDDEVKVNHAFRSADLSGESIARVVADTAKILN